MYTASEGDRTMVACLIAEGEGLPTHSISVPIAFVNHTAYCECLSYLTYICILDQLGGILLQFT